LSWLVVVRTKRTQLLRIGVALAMVVLTLIYVRELDWSAIGESAAGASIVWLVISAAGNVPLIWLKAQRLRLLVGRRVPTGRLMGMYVASYAADNLVMSQAGLGVRVAILVRDELALATAITSQVVEKVCEGVGLAILAAPLLAAPELDSRLRTGVQWCLALGGAGLVFLVVLTLLRDRAQEPGASPGRMQRIVRRVAEIASALREPGVALRVLGLTLAAWVVEVGIVYAALSAVHLPVTSIYMPILVLVAVNVAALVPGLPANMGAFEIACVLSLGTFGVERDAAVGFGLLYHAMHTIPVTLVGLPGFIAATRRRPVELAEPAG
jgi:uncharacterized membrane protein YbhN (UPF0104 family)